MGDQERAWRLRGRPVALAHPLLLAVLVLSGVSVAWANGGTLRLANVPMGEYRASVFTDPTPVRPDTLDVSVLVLREGALGVAEDVRVTVRTRALAGQGPETEREATRDQADDPRYHAAKFALGAEGEWEVTVAVSGPDGQGEAAFQVVAREPGLLGHPLFLAGLALLPLLAVALWIFRQEDPGGEASGDHAAGGEGPGNQAPGGPRDMADPA